VLLVRRTIIITISCPQYKHPPSHDWGRTTEELQFAVDRTSVSPVALSSMQRGMAGALLGLSTSSLRYCRVVGVLPRRRPWQSAMECWEPLPPRLQSNRKSRQRRREASSYASLDEEWEETRSEIRSPIERHLPRNNRRGFNSYLKVELDAAAMLALRDLTRDVRSRYESLEPSSDSSAAQQQHSRNIAKGKKKFGPTRDPQPLVSIRPRPLNSLHMTFFFGAETLCELPSQELARWHSEVSTRLGQSGFCRLANNNHPRNPSSDLIGEGTPYWFRFQKVCTFPPNRNNLLVVLLEASPQFHALHSDVRNIAKGCQYSRGLREVTQCSHDKWTAHITLANLTLRGPKKLYQPALKQLNDLLLASSTSLFGADETHSKVVYPACISMGGPMPRQVSLDWSFRFRPEKEIATET
jgi:hypothetical protein